MLYSLHMSEIEELRKENEELKKIHTLRSDWIAISSHELRTSLSANKWILKMFLDKDFGPITTEQEGFIKKAYEANERMLGLINEMLAINHTQDASLITYNFKDSNIIELIEGIIFDFHGESFKKGIEVLFLKPDPLPTAIRIDDEKIRVVLQNLIENAIKYSNQGDRVIISVIDSPDKLTISVKDNGIGIPLDEQQRIFEKFFRASNAKDKESVGSGLGLYTTKTIIEAHGGTLTFESIPDQSTTFSFTLPRK